MSDVTLFGFPRSVYVQMAGIVLTHKEVPYTFHDLEIEMNTESHIALHPFERVPILRHGDFTVYETSAIVGYIDDAFDGSKLTPADPRQRARMNQWISSVNGYYYPYLIYHVSTCNATNWMRRRIASPGVFLEAEPLPHLICSRPMFIGGVKDAADQHGGTGRVGDSDSGAVFPGG